MPNASAAEIRVLGPLEVRGPDGAVPVSAFKQRLLLATLLVDTTSVQSTDALVEALWGEAPPASAGKLVQTYVSQLRRLLPREIEILTQEPGYRLELSGGRVDAVRFERLLDEGREAARIGNPMLASSLLRQALALWRGQAFGDLAFEDAVRFEAERLEELRTAATEERFEAELQLGQHDALLPELRGYATAHPSRERLQGQLMLALYRAGQQTEALDVYRAARTALADELGLEPGPDLRELEQRILQHDPSLVLGEREQQGSTLLPVPSNRLRGRERELADIQALLTERTARLLVLTGAGGSGKTRLALDAAHASASSFANGADFVELAPVRDPGSLLPAIASAIGVQSTDEEPLDALVDALGPQERLLVLDNLEHLVAGSSPLAELLERVPRLTLLVTSRVVLHLSGEHVYPVEPLATDAAVELFVERARSADARFETDEVQLLAVARICERLDFLPLALELAASRTRTLTPLELEERLGQRLPLLSDGPRDLPARQQTLRSTIDWSLDLLAPDEQRDFVRLSVFVGGFDLPAAEAVAGSGIDQISSFLDASLLERTITTRGSRYRMLETIRELSSERLESVGETEAIGQAHARHALGVAESLGLSADSTGTGAEEEYDRAYLEQGNLRRALDWALDHDPELGLRLAIALMKFWIAVSPSEGVQRISALIERAGDVPVELMAPTLRDLGGCLQMRGRGVDAGIQYRASLALYEELGDHIGVVTLRYRLAIVALMGGNVVDARRLAEEALVDARALGARFEESRILDVLGGVEFQEGNLESAYALMLQSLAISRALGGWKWGDAIALVNLADVACRLNRPDEAEQHALEALGLSIETRDRTRTVFALASLALAARARGEGERAGTLWGAIEAEEERTPLEGWASERAEFAERITTSDGDFQQGRTAGQALTLDAAAAYARD